MSFTARTIQFRPWHARGQGFESPRLHHYSLTFLVMFRVGYEVTGYLLGALSPICMQSCVTILSLGGVDRSTKGALAKLKVPSEKGYPDRIKPAWERLARSPDDPSLKHPRVAFWTIVIRYWVPEKERRYRQHLHLAWPPIVPALLAR